MAGKLVHFEIPATDSERAKTFYSGLLGWQFQEPFGGMDYHMTRTGEDQGGAVSGMADVGHLTVYFDVDDIDASLAKVRELGGEAGDKQPIPGVGWFARCTDSEGNDVSLFQSDESVQPG